MKKKNLTKNEFERWLKSRSDLTASELKVELENLLDTYSVSSALMNRIQELIVQGSEQFNRNDFVENQELQDTKITINVPVRSNGDVNLEFLQNSVTFDDVSMGFVNQHKSLEELKSRPQRIKSFVNKLDEVVPRVKIDWEASGELVADVEDALTAALMKLVDKSLPYSDREDDRVMCHQEATLEVATPVIERNNFNHIQNVSVEKFLDCRYSHRWVYLTSDDCLDGKFDNLIEVFFPYYVEPHILEQRAHGLALAFTRYDLHRKIIDACVTPFILKGRTEYGKKRPLLLSNVIEIVVNHLNHLKVDERNMALLPLLSLVLHELEQTQLIVRNVKFIIACPVALNIAATGYSVPNLFIKEEVKKFFMAYSNMVKATRFEGIVEASAISTSYVGSRTALSDDLVHLGRVYSQYKSLLPVLTACALKIPVRFRIKHPDLDSDTVIKTLLNYYEVLKSVTFNTDQNWGPTVADSLCELQTGEFSYIEIKSLLDWFRVRLGTLAEYQRSISDVIHEFCLDYCKFPNGTFHTAMVVHNGQSQHSVGVVKATRYASTNSFLLQDRERTGLQEKLNTISDGFTNRFSGDKYLKHLMDRVQSGELPANTFICKSDQKYKELLAIALHGFIKLGHNAFFVNFWQGATKDIGSETVESSSSFSFAAQGVTSLTPTLIWELPTSGLALGNVMFQVTHIQLVNVNTYLWCHILKEERRQQPSKKQATPELSVSSFGNATRINFLLDPVFKPLNRSYLIEGTVNDIPVKTIFSLAAAYPRFPVAGSQLIIRKSGSLDMSVNMMLFLLLEQLATQNKITEASDYKQHIEGVFDDACCVLLSEIVTLVPEFTYLAHRLGCKIAMQLAPKVGAIMTDLDNFTLKQLSNFAGVEVIRMLNDLLELVDPKVLDYVIERAKRSTRWFNSELFAILA